MDINSDSSTTSVISDDNESRKNSNVLTDDESDNDDDEYKPLPKPIEARSTPPIRIIDENKSNRPLLYSENSYGLYARGRPTNHLTIECLVSVPAHLFVWDDALGGFLPYNGHTICNVNLLQQISCQQILSPTLIQPSARNSWSADHTVNNNNTLSAPSVTKVTPIWEYSIQCQRKSDSKTIIECLLAPHMTYICALPTFHHWRISDKKFALSFASDYSASKFHNRLQKALSHLTRQSKSTIAGSGESNLDTTDDLDDEVFAPTDSSENQLICSKPWIKRNLNFTPTICPSLSITNHLNEDINYYEEDLNTVPPLCSMLPTTHFDDCQLADIDTIRQPGSGLSLATVSPCVNCHKCYGFMSSISSEDPSSAGAESKKMSLSPKNSDSSKPKLIQSSSSGSSTHEKSSLKFSKMRSIRSCSNPGSIMMVQKLFQKNSRENEITKSKSLLEAHLRNVYPSSVALRNASFEIIQRERCKYCNQWYNVKDNKRGDCPDAPDTVERWIKRVTLYSWANNFVNKRVCHNRENDCSTVCEPPCFTNKNRASIKRRLWFVLLSCAFPCLCFYHPMTKIYHSDKFHQIYSCCGNCSPESLPKESHQDDVLSSTASTRNRRRNRRRIGKSDKHVPVSPKGKVRSMTGSRKRIDQIHQQSSRTSSTQQMLNDSYFKTASGYGSLIQQSTDGFNITLDKSSGDSTKTDYSRKMIRPLCSRLSF